MDNPEATPDALPSPEQLLTPEECAQVDQTLLPYRDRFAIRIAIYALRCLQQIQQETGLAIASLRSDQIANWVKQDQRVQQSEAGKPGFADWYTEILISSFNPLQQAAESADIQIEDLTIQQIIAWFEQAVRQRL
jgi:hypothetical protein